ncbi:MAG: LysE family translocator [Hyphomicrobiaceae bacterium]|nr:LysE family translocator [Hyphomicrobiaceae bacterium]MCC0023762.1 LysE family translocator [Hyphomicrobiaceae bacterium]
MVEFVPSLATILAFALASFVLAITPGPDMALFISRTVNYGRAHGVAAVLGATSGLMVHVLLAAFGVSVLLVTAPTAFLVLKIAGALYLLWLAVGAIRQTGGLKLAEKKHAGSTLLRSYLIGIGINLTNPKVLLFFITFFPQFVSRDDPDAPFKLLFLGGEFLVVSVPIVIAIVFGAHWVAKWLVESALVRRLLNYSFAAVFAAFAAVILTAQARH